MPFATYGKRRLRGLVVLIWHSLSIVGILLKGTLWLPLQIMRYAFEKSSIATFISLLSKVVGADDIKKFRPISLVGDVYKILAKA